MFLYLIFYNLRAIFVNSNFNFLKQKLKLQ